MWLFLSAHQFISPSACYYFSQHISLFPCVHVAVYFSQHISLFPCLHFTIYFHLDISLFPHLHLAVYPPPPLPVSLFPLSPVCPFPGCTPLYFPSLHLYSHCRGMTSVRRVQELCESRGGHPGLSVLMSLTVSVDVKQYWTMLTHWSQLVPHVSADIQGH